MKKKTIGKACAVLMAAFTLIASTGCESYEFVPSKTQHFMSEVTGSNFRYWKYDDHISIQEYLGESTTVIIPEEIESLPVTEIGASAFAENEEIESVTIPKTVSTIREEAFSSCYALNKISIPRSVKEVGYAVFDATAWLANQKDDFVVVGDGVLIVASSKDKDVKLPSSVKYISDAFAMTDVTSVTIPGSVKNIGDYAFYGCENLTKLEIPSSVTNIGAYAFKDSGIKDVKIPETVSYIGFKPFENTPFLENYKEDFVILGDGVLMAYKGKDKKVTIPDGVKMIAEGAFYENMYMETVSIPASCTYIDEYAFGTSMKLKKVTIPKTVEYIGTGAFRYCAELESVAIKTNAIIPEYMFDACSKLKSVELADGVEVISFSAFSYCEALEKINIPDSVFVIGGYAFDSCKALKSLNVGSSVKELGDKVFNGCEDTLTLTCDAKGYVKDYADANNISTASKD